MNPPTKPATRIPGGIWALGFVSLLMGVSSELIHSLLPVFMFTALGVSVFTIGLIEGAAEATALIVKIFSGALSDYWGKRKPLALTPLVLIGMNAIYSVSALRTRCTTGSGSA